MVEASQLLEEADKLRNSQGNLSGALEKIGAILDFDKKNTAVLLQKAIIERDLGKIEQAKDTLKNILSNSKEDDVSRVTATRMYAELLLMQNELEQAYDRAAEAVHIAREVAKAELVASACTTHGYIALVCDKRDEALQLLAEAHSLAVETHFSERIAEIEVYQALLATDTSLQEKTLDELIERSFGRWLSVWFEAVVGRLSVALQPHSDVLTVAKRAYQIAADNGWIYYQARLAQQLARVVAINSPEIAEEYKKTADQLFEKLYDA